MSTATKITVKDLHKFCGGDSKTLDLSNPFTWNTCTVAADNRVIIVCPDMKCENRLRLGPTATFADVAIRNIKILDETVKALSDLEGCKCELPEIDRPVGVDENFQIDVSKFEFDIRCHDVSAAVKSATHLDGTKPIEIQGVHFKRLHITKIQTLPNIRYSISGPDADWMDFTFDGGAGRLMGMGA